MHPILAWLPHGTDFLWIFLAIILLFGADKLPKLARGLGKSLGEFKKAKDEFEKEVHAAAAEPDVKKLDDKSSVATTTGAATTSGEPAKKI